MHYLWLGFMFKPENCVQLFSTFEHVCSSFVQAFSSFRVTHILAFTWNKTVWNQGQGQKKFLNGAFGRQLQLNSRHICESYCHKGFSWNKVISKTTICFEKAFQTRSLKSLNTENSVQAQAWTAKCFQAWKSLKLDINPNSKVSNNIM